MDRTIRTVEDVLSLLDGLFAPGADRWTTGAADWWDGFYADRSKPVPFFVAKPDENLVSYLDRDLISPGRALDLGLLERVLAPGGHLAMTRFAAGGMGSELPDAEFYRASGLQGGLAYTPESLRLIFSDFTEVELRRMRDEPAESALFGEDFL
ncbi:hypothetical protein [Streptomyces sp. NPDC091371]|uniref:hypothetical protein n=1 Tax=Streptomyces sp. NPDC091371 TaxID=3155303 RepID=UPI00344780C4